MCGRYTLRSTGEEVAEVFDLDEVPEVPSRYNIAPTEEVPIVRVARASGRRELARLRWGLIPWFARDPREGARSVNARAESLFEKPAFRGPAERRRCLIPADGFYEWKPAGKRKQPYYFELVGGGVFGLAGIWERWRPRGGGDEDAIESFSIVTVDANPDVAPIHDRMPLIVPRALHALWLDPDARTRGALEPVLGSVPAGVFRCYPVGPHVNKAGNDDPACVTPLNRVHFDRAPPGRRGGPETGDLFR